MTSKVLICHCKIQKEEDTQLRQILFNHYQNTNSKSLLSSKSGDCEEHIVYLVHF